MLFFGLAMVFIMIWRPGGLLRVQRRQYRPAEPRVTHHHGPDALADQQRRESATRGFHFRQLGHIRTSEW